MNVIPDVKERCGSCPIRHRAVCSTCNESELQVLDGIKTYRTFAAGDEIAWRGDKLRFVGSVVSGVASLGKTLEDGRTQMVGLLLPSDFIGRPGRDTIEFDVTAVTDVTLCCFEIREFEALLEKTPRLAQRLMQMALDELDAARDWMLLLGRKTAREKIATFVQLLVKRQGSFDGNPMMEGSVFELPLTREEIANYLGLTLETVSRQFSRLKSEGVLTFEGRRALRVPNLNALQTATGDDDDGGVIV